MRSYNAEIFLWINTDGLINSTESIWKTTTCIAFTDGTSYA